MAAQGPAGPLQGPPILPPGVSPAQPGALPPPVGAENTSLAPGLSPYIYAPGITHLCGATAGTSFSLAANAASGGAVVLLIWTTDAKAVSKVSDNFGSVYRQAVPSTVGATAEGAIYYCSNLFGANPTITITLASSGACLAFVLPVIGASQQWFLEGAAFHQKVTGETTSFPAVQSLNAGDIFITGWGSGSAPSSNPAGLTVQSYSVPTSVFSDTTFRIAWSNSPVVANTKGPIWGNSASNASGSMTIVIRAAGVNPSQTGVFPQPLLPGLPQGPFAPAAPAYVETLVPLAAPSTITLGGQTITSSEGTVTPTVSYSLTALTVTSSEGTLSPGLSYALSAQTITSSEGTVTPSLAYSLTGQTATFAEGTLIAGIAANLTEQTATFTEGTITATGGDQSQVTVHVLPPGFRMLRCGGSYTA